MINHTAVQLVRVNEHGYSAIIRRTTVTLNRSTFRTNLAVDDDLVEVEITVGQNLVDINVAPRSRGWRARLLSVEPTDDFIAVIDCGLTYVAMGHHCSGDKAAAGRFVLKHRGRVLAAAKRFVGALATVNGL